MKRKKICFYPGSLNLGGVGSLTINLANEYGERGHDVYIYLNKYQGEYLGRVSNKVKLVAGRGSALKSFFHFREFLNDKNFDVIISARDYLNLVALLAVGISLVKTKVICSVHIDYSSMPKSKPNIKYFIQNFILSKLKLYNSSHAIVAVSKGVADDFLRRFNIETKRVKVIYNPTYNPEQYINSDTPTKLKEFSDNKPIIIGVGRLTEQKNFELLIKAFSKVEKKIDSRLVILGEGELRDSLNKIIVTLSIKDKVLMPGFVDNPIDYIMNSDVFVLPSLYEGFGNVLVEALGTGISVVSTNCLSGPAEILNKGEFGTLVPVNDVNAMAHAIMIKLETPDEKEKNKVRASDFSISKIADQYYCLM